MSDNRKKRNRKPRQIEERRTILLANRDSDRSSKADDMPIQPKILQKVRDPNEAGPSGTLSILMPQKPTILTKESASTEPTILTKELNVLENGIASVSTGLSATENTISQSPNTTSQNKEIVSDHPLVEPTPIMTRPATVISSTFQINYNAAKFVQKTNKDFLVVGVVGRQGVGKSTIMNLLAEEELTTETLTMIFKEEEIIFPIKVKPHKGAAWPRTESVHMYITKDRTIFLDSPPVLCNSYKKDELATEVDDLHNIITVMSLCHLVLFVQNDYFDMNLVRLFQMAEMTIPNQSTKPYIENYYPNVLFIKNRAKRSDYLSSEKANMDKMLRFCFEQCKMKIFVGETDDQKKFGNLLESEKIVNTFLIPDVRDFEKTSYHADILSIVADLRTRVSMTPRNQIYGMSGEMTEANWFELLSKVASEWNHFFFRAFKEARVCHYQCTTEEAGKCS